MTDIAIRVKGLGKKYKLGLTHKGSLRKAVSGLSRKLLRRKRVDSDQLIVDSRNDSSSLATSNYQLATTSPQTNGNGSNPNEFWALKDVSFEVKRGEVLGVIGRWRRRQRKWDWLRSGRSVPVPIFQFSGSTLLKILSQVTKPTTGRAEIYGRVGSLLEVGTGFHPELTGRENVYLNGAILGMTRREIDRKFDEIVDFSGVAKFIDTPVKQQIRRRLLRKMIRWRVPAHGDPQTTGWNN